MGSHSITCHPAEVTFPLLPQPIKAGTRFSDPRGMQGWVYLIGLVTYRGGIPARRRSPIPALTGLNVEQLRSCDERRYHHSAKLLSGFLRRSETVGWTMGSLAPFVNIQTYLLAYTPAGVCGRCPLPATKHNARIATVLLARISACLISWWCERQKRTPNVENVNINVQMVLDSAEITF